MGFEPKDNQYRAADPYRSPHQIPWETGSGKERNIAVFILLMLVTLGIYWFYVVFAWAKEVNGWMGREKYSPPVVLLLNIVTCGIAGLIYECLFAYDIDSVTAARGLPHRQENLGVWVLVLNMLAMVLCGLLGLAASAVLQAELNKLAQHETMLA